VCTTRRAAAPIRLLHLHQLHPGNHLEHLAWLLVHLLTMDEMAGILVGDAQADPPRRRPEPHVDEELGGILDGPGERRTGLPERGIVTELNLVLLHVGAAAGGVD